MKLCKTKTLMDSLLENRDLDSYAILVCSDGEKSLLTSSNVNEDTYFVGLCRGKGLQNAA